MPLSAAVLLVGLLRAAPAAADPLDVARADARRAETLWREGKATTDDALDAASRAVELCTKGFGVASPEAAKALRVRGLVFQDRTEWARAQSDFEAALDATRRSQAADPVAVAERIVDVADVLELAGRTDDAGARSAEAEALLSRSDPAAAATVRGRLLALRARLVRDHGDYAQALTLAHTALAALQGSNPDEPAEHVGALNLLGELEWFVARYDRSRDWHLQALELARLAMGPAHPIVGETLADLAQAEFDLGNLARAQELEVEALEITRAARGPTHSDTLDRLHSLANFAQDAGAYPRALDLYDEVQRATTARFGPESDESAHVFYNTGVLEGRMGEPEQAAADFRRARDIWERLRGPAHPFVALPLESLANLLAEQGRLEEADSLLTRAIAIRESPGAGQPMNLALALAHLAWVRVQKGAPADAIELEGRALALCGHEDGRSQADVAQVLALLGQLDLRLGRVPEAAERLGAAHRMYTDLLGPDHPRAASARSQWADCLLRQGRSDAAFREALAAETTRREHLGRTVRYLAQSQALSFAARQASGRDVLLSVAAGPGATSDQKRGAFLGLVLGRALVLDEMAARGRAARALRDTAAGSLQVELDAAGARFARLLYREVDEPQERRAAVLAQAWADLEALERRAASETAAARRGVPMAAGGVADLAARLPHATALVSFVRYRDVRDTTQGSDEPPDRYLAFVLRRGSRTPSVIALGPAPLIDGLIAAWRSGLGDVASVVAQPETAERSSRRDGLRLRQVIWDPLQRQLGGVSRAYIVPDGALGLLNLAALPDSAGGYVAESGPTIYYMSSERDLLREIAPEELPGRLLALGGPDYDAEPKALQLVRDAPARTIAARQQLPRARGSDCNTIATRFSPLPAAADETSDIASLWTRARRTGQLTLRIGPEASEAAFKREAVGASLLHVATHGFFTEDSCPDPATRSVRQSGLAVEFAVVADPLLRAGLALASANRRATGREGLEANEDGLLTAAEVARLDLSRARTVVLSACGTGLGRVQAGEGVIGLQRAFVTAGAGVVVMSLWAVDDAETRNWMRSFYAALLVKRLDGAEAVREAERAQIARLRREMHAAPPALWAAFVASGR